MKEIQVLPHEVLGWLLLRRANLSAQSRLRDQEEELLAADSQRAERQDLSGRGPWRRTEDGQ